MRKLLTIALVFLAVRLAWKLLPGQRALVHAFLLGMLQPGIVKSGNLAKGRETESRIPALVAKAGTLTTSVNGMQPVVTVVAGWPLFLGTLNQEVQPSTFGGPSSNSNADLFSWANNQTSRTNQIYSLMVGTNLWT